MPHDYKKYTNPMDDGRRKIAPSDHEAVRELHRELKSQRKVAIAFQCSRRLITLILYPERYEAQLKQRREAKAHLAYYERKAHALAMRKYRKKKREKGLNFSRP